MGKSKNTLEPRFSVDWFSRSIPQWEKMLAHLAGKPKLKFLEIGVLEGKCSCWLLNNILTHPTSRLVCMDTFEGSMEHQEGAAHTFEQLDSLYDRFMRNVSPFAEKVDVQIGQSQVILRKHRLHSYDFIYIDGSHKSPDVLEDGVLCFRLLKAGGIMIFDDYDWPTYAGTLDNPKFGIDSFLDNYAGQYAVLFKDYQVAIQKH